MGRPGGYYRDREFIKATPEELADRARGRRERKQAREFDRTFDRDDIAEFVKDS
jgi:hypothetical protein